MQRIDAHQHFWQYKPVRDSWITEDMAVIRRDFLPDDLWPLLQTHGFEGCVAVQADQSEEETNFLLRLADKHAFIKGVVGWVDLTANNVEERLAYFKGFKKLVGFRHILQVETVRDFMLQEAFCRGIALLKTYDFTYDILIHADQLKFIPAFVEAFPEQRFVLDHIAKPDIKGKSFDQWAKEMQTVSTYQNVFCKISGMVTEADWKAWKPADFVSYLNTAVECFGLDRVMFGSDWPVCLVAASYGQTFNLIAGYFAGYDVKTRDAFFGSNAARFYQLK